MKTIRISFPYPLGKHAIDSVMMRAEAALDAGFIHELPQVTVEPTTTPGYMSLVINSPEDDLIFWFGCYYGADMVRNNREWLDKSP